MIHSFEPRDSFSSTGWCFQPDDLWMPNLFQTHDDSCFPTRGFMFFNQLFHCQSEDQRRITGKYSNTYSLFVFYGEILLKIGWGCWGVPNLKIEKVVWFTKRPFHVFWSIWNEYPTFWKLFYGIFIIIRRASSRHSTKHARGNEI